MAPASGTPQWISASSPSRLPAERMENRRQENRTRTKGDREKCWEKGQSIKNPGKKGWWSTLGSPGEGGRVGARGKGPQILDGLVTGLGKVGRPLLDGHFQENPQSDVPTSCC